MKNIKITSIVAIIATIALWSCSKTDVRPTNTKASMTVKSNKTHDQNNYGSNMRVAGGHNSNQIEHFVQAARIIGRNQNSVVTFDLEYNDKTNTFKMKNIHLPQQFTLPFDYNPSAEAVTVECIGGDGDGNSTTCDDDSDSGCVSAAVWDCMCGGGIASVCEARIIHMAFIPKNML